MTLKNVIRDKDVNTGETLIWNDDGFCWLRGAHGVRRGFQGTFSTLVEAEEACRAAGFSPTQWYLIQKAR